MEKNHIREDYPSQQEESRGARLPLDYTVTTERCYLRIGEKADIPHAFFASQYPGFTDGMSWNPPATPEELLPYFTSCLEKWKSGQCYTFTIETRMDGEFIGRIDIRAKEKPGAWSIGYWTHPKYHGHGFMTEAASAVLDLGFVKLGAKHIEGVYARWNKASGRVMEKIGMKFIENIPNHVIKPGIIAEAIRFGIEKQEWKTLWENEKACREEFPSHETSFEYR